MLQYALLAAAALGGGTQPDLLDEVAWWQTDDFWQYALFAAVAILRPGEARARLEAFIAERARTGRGIPAAPYPGKIAGAVTADGIVQAPNRALISLLAGIPGGLWYHHARLAAAGACDQRRSR